MVDGESGDFGAWPVVGTAAHSPFSFSDAGSQRGLLLTAHVHVPLAALSLSLHL